VKARAAGRGTKPHVLEIARALGHAFRRGNVSVGFGISRPFRALRKSSIACAIASGDESHFTPSFHCPRDTDPAEMLTDLVHVTPARSSASEEERRSASVWPHDSRTPALPSVAKSSKGAVLVCDVTVEVPLARPALMSSHWSLGRGAGLQALLDGLGRRDAQDLRPRGCRRGRRVIPLCSRVRREGGRPSQVLDGTRSAGEVDIFETAGLDVPREGRPHLHVQLGGDLVSGAGRSSFTSAGTPGTWSSEPGRARRLRAYR